MRTVTAHTLRTQRYLLQHRPPPYPPRGQGPRALG